MLYARKIFAIMTSHLATRKDRQPRVDDLIEFPVPLDNLIAYVRAMRPDAGPLENVSDAFSLSNG